MDLHVLGHFRKLIQSTIHEKYPKIRTQIVPFCPRRFTEATQTNSFPFQKFVQNQQTQKSEFKTSNSGHIHQQSSPINV